MSVEWSFEQEARENLKIDNRITQEEKKFIRDAIKKDAPEVIQTASSGHKELSDFIRKEYWFLSQQNVGIEGIKRFQKSQGLNDDGQYGNKTFQAVVQYQIANRIRPADGIITQNILANLLGETSGGNSEAGKERFYFDEAVAIAYLQKKYSPEDIKNISKMLKLNKRATLNQIVEAIARFQKVEGGLTIDGILGPKTLAVLQDSQQRRYSTPMTNEDIARMNAESDTVDKSKVFEKLPSKWKVIFKEFYLKARNETEQKEILTGKYPVALANSRTRKGVLIVNGKTYEFPVAFGTGIVRDKKGNIIKQSDPIKNGFSEGDHSTNAGVICRFDRGLDYKGGGKKLESPEAREYGLKWWHAVEAGQQTTWGCIGVPYDIASLMAKEVNKTKKGFGYVSEV